MWKNRDEAASELAVMLNNFSRRPDVLVVALPDGGAVLGRAVSQALRLPLEPMGTNVECVSKTVIVIDDGMVTGKTMLAAATAIRERGAVRVVIAVPVGSPQAVERVRPYCDELFILKMPSYLGAVGSYYEDPRV